MEEFNGSGITVDNSSKALFAKFLEVSQLWGDKTAIV